jgi:hypothetical protein
MRVWTGARAIRTGQVFFVRKVILEFSAASSGRANVSVRKLNLQNFFLAFERHQFRPNPIFE